MYHCAKSSSLAVIDCTNFFSFAIAAFLSFYFIFIETRLSEILEDIQKALFEKAKAFRDSHIHTATNMDEMKDIAENQIGFIRAMWCGDDACEEAIKDQTGGVTSRCIPEEQEEISNVCVCCGKPAKHMVYWGKAY